MPADNMTAAIAPAEAPATEFSPQQTLSSSSSSSHSEPGTLGTTRPFVSSSMAANAPK